MVPEHPPREVELRAVQRPEELEGLVDLFEEVFGMPVPNVVDMRGSILAGGFCAGAWIEEQLTAALWSLSGWDGKRPCQHSHLTAVRSQHQGLGIGEALKRFHASWCRANGIERIRWTFDPLVVGNARFNLNRLGAIGEAWVEDCYGPLSGLLDPLSLTGEAAPSDRLLVTWYLSEPPHLPQGKLTRVEVPPTAGESSGAVSVRDGVLRLRLALGRLLEHGAVVTGIEPLGEDGRWAYRVVQGAPARGTD